MRKLAEDLAVPRGAHSMWVSSSTLTPYRPVDLAVRRTDRKPNSTLASRNLRKSRPTPELEIALAGIATFRVRGGRREAQAKVVALEERWNNEVAPHLRQQR